MQTKLNHETALEILRKYNSESFHIRHGLTVEGCMKWFAAGCSREIITEGAEKLGWTLEDLMERTILVMRSCETDVNEEMQKLGME